MQISCWYSYTIIKSHMAALVNNMLAHYYTVLSALTVCFKFSDVEKFCTGAAMLNFKCDA